MREVSHSTPSLLNICWRESILRMPNLSILSILVGPGPAMFADYRHYAEVVMMERGVA